jgi:lipase chaperone LimK
VRDLPPLALDPQVMRDTKIAVDAAGHLVPDRALRRLMDEFLVKGNPSERQAKEVQLRELLRDRLKLSAAGEADRLVTDYLAYLNVEQQMLSRERFTQPDASGLTDEQVQHLLAWQKRRADLRQRMLGTSAASAWFDEEDGGCASALGDWEKQMAPPDDDDSNEQFARRRYGQRLAEGRNHDAQACAAQIAGSMHGAADGDNRSKRWNGKRLGCFSRPRWQAASCWRRRPRKRKSKSWSSRAWGPTSRWTR